MLKDQNQPNHFLYEQPVSLQARMFDKVMQLSGIKFRMQNDLKKHTINHRRTKIPTSFSKKFQVQIHLIAENPIYVIKPKNINTDKTLLYLHGGAYLYGIQSFYWRFIKELVIKTGATVIVPDYPLTPEYTAEQVYSFMIQTYEWIKTFTDVSKLSLLGDSAGGGLAFGLAQVLRNEKRSLPVQLILISPWLDISLTNKEISNIEKKDPVLTLKGLQLAGKAYSGFWENDDFRISPVNGELHDLPRINLFTGTYDILFADIRRLKKRLEESDLQFNYFKYPGMFHAWPVVWPRLKESQLVFQQIAGLIYK